MYSTHGWKYAKVFPNKDMKAFAKDLKTIYHAPNEKLGKDALDIV